MEPVVCAGRWNRWNAEKSHPEIPELTYGGVETIRGTLDGLNGWLESLLGTQLFLSAAYILIVTGAVVVLLAFLGCCGAIKEVKCMLLTYSTLLFLLFVVLLVAGILGYVFRGRVEESIDGAMKKALMEYDDEKADPIKIAWDDAQRKFKCCGIDKAEDWKLNDKLKGRFPSSCCRVEGNDKLKCEDNESYTWSEGCKNKLETYVQDHGTVIGGVGIGIAVLTLLGIVFGCALSKKPFGIRSPGESGPDKEATVPLINVGIPKITWRCVPLHPSDHRPSYMSLEHL
ncbi:unnamed protein product [Darwinula stevensoni]|uniref:Tetraspanin n=1 Tax=Darwinula stevensoni TaxID=69355 RepID=A0A7R9AGJ4_9CRUS|nr:unnamed protein product [Darwinula stevensoni]CAG0903731.1 unnamed protein product [Darwinula stevensoni]